MNLLRLLLTFTFAFYLIFPITVFAHPGRTDSAGGHTNRSTGEYHYHHGYSEHDHYDMDGDGDLDCPYDFDDKTGSSGKGNNSSSITPIKPTVKEEPKVQETTQSEKSEKDSKKPDTFYDHTRDVISDLLETLYVLAAVSIWCIAPVVICWIIEKIRKKIKK